MKAKLILELEAAPNAENEKLVNRDGKRFWPMGAVIEESRSYRLVQMGVAIPEDEECERAAGMNLEQMSVAQKAYRRVAAGIHPSDYDRFDNGEITGYDEEGNDIPGPNYVEPEEEEDE